MKFNTLIAVAGVLLLSGNNAHACLGPMLEYQTFFEELPTKVMESPVIAKVKIVAKKFNKDTMKTRYQVEVVEAIGGTKMGDQFVIDYRLSSCSRESDIKTGKSYYIAGKLEEEGFTVNGKTYP
ncbi:MAG: hypothetical protein MRY32_07395 [Rickettsiales bacterium]|nr:hypothetical protein [Rickettsiales bacterium]